MKWLACLPDLHKHQWPTQFDWNTWVMLGGRGSGKTLAGAYWLHKFAYQDKLTIALVGPAFHDVREVMIEGPSGLRALAHPDNPVRWEASRKRLVWENGSVAYAFSAEDADGLRGPQFHMAWADEFCAWRAPETVLNTLRFAMRRGPDPRLIVTTTPRPMTVLRRLTAQPGTIVTRGATQVNKAHLSPGFMEHLTRLYGGTRLEAQEMQGTILDTDGSLFRAEDLARARAAGTRAGGSGEGPGRLDRIVVAVDPPVTSHGDACGIVVVGRCGDTAHVLADRSIRGLSPLKWAERVAGVVEEFGAHSVVAETNQGGEMVSTVLDQAGCRGKVKRVHATRGKVARAEPVATLYEQGRVFHWGDFAELEEELMGLGSGERGHSPDRADALVWAITDLMLNGRGDGPRVRRL